MTGNSDIVHLALDAVWGNGNPPRDHESRVEQLIVKLKFLGPKGTLREGLYLSPKRLTMHSVATVLLQSATLWRFQQE